MSYPLAIISQRIIIINAIQILKNLTSLISYRYDMGYLNLEIINYTLSILDDINKKLIHIGFSWVIFYQLTSNQIENAHIIINNDTYIIDEYRSCIEFRNNFGIYAF